MSSYYETEEVNYRLENSKQNRNKKKIKDLQNKSQTSLTCFIVGFISKGHSKYVLISNHVFNLRFQNKTFCKGAFKKGL